MTAAYDPLLTFMSCGVAILGCMSALALAAQLGKSSPYRWQKLLAWLNGGLILGVAVWSTNLLAMAAVKFPALANYGIMDAVTGIGIAVAASLAGLYLAGSKPLGAFSLLLGGVVIGAGIAGMHYRALRYVPACDFPCEPHLATAAAVVVLCLSIAALWVALCRHRAWRLIAGSLLLGPAVVLMSYAAMMGVYVLPLNATGAPLLSEDFIAYAMACTSLATSAGGLMLLALISKDSMTREQITLVQASFHVVEQHGALAGDLFYQRLFELAPDVRMFFPKDLTNQKGKFLAVLAGAVLNLHRVEQVLPVVRDLGQRHINYGVEPEHYAPVGEALLWTLEQVLAEDFTPATKAAWKAAYNMLASAMIKAAAEADFEHRHAARGLFSRRAA